MTTLTQAQFVETNIASLDMNAMDETSLLHIIGDAADSEDLEADSEDLIKKHYNTLAQDEAFLEDATDLIIQELDNGSQRLKDGTVRVGQ